MKTIVIGDVHGCYKELKEMIETLEENGEYKKGVDKLVFLGDYIDRGSDSRLVIQFIRNLQKNYDNVIALMGNHEDMLLNYLYEDDASWTWNGYEATMDSYKGFDKQFKSDVQWMKALPLYHEDENFIYVHAGVDVYASIEEQNEYTLLWVREPFIYSTKEYYKQVVFGHTPVMFLDENDNKPVYTYTHNIDIDTGCVYGGALTALIIEDGEVNGFYQVHKGEVSNDEEDNKINV